MKELNITVLKKLDNNFGIVDNFGNLGAILNCPPRILSYVRKYKKEKRMQTLVVVGDRKTYKSDRQLAAIQKAIKDKIAQKIFNSLEDTKHILAYKKGFDYRKELQDCINNDLQISFDIKKCYDSITYKHIVRMLQYYGFTHRGAKLVAGYCVVERTVNGHIINTLQQGSACSPIISNLVLNLMIDEPLKAWLNHYIVTNKLDISYKYYRYSDNVALFIRGNTPLEFLKYYREQYRLLTNSNNIWVHDEYVTKSNHPFRNQRFLGIVLNKVARIDLREFSKLRAILFNCCRNGINIEATKYLKEKLYELTFNDELPYDIDDIIEKFKNIMQGKISYIKNISEKQYNILNKLLKTACILYDYNNDSGIKIYNEGLRKDLFDYIKGTKTDLEQYLLGLADLLKIPKRIDEAPPTFRPSFVDATAANVFTSSSSSTLTFSPSSSPFFWR